MKKSDKKSVEIFLYILFSPFVIVYLITNFIIRRIKKKLRNKRLIKTYGEDVGTKLVNHNYFIGMTIQQLIDCKGKPNKIENDVTATKIKKTFIYGNKSSGDVFVFINDILVNFKDR